MARNCPVCQSVELEPTLMVQGVETDFCPQCKGVWLDRGEIFHFSENPGKLKPLLDQAIKESTPSSRVSPASSMPMREIRLFEGKLSLNYCEQSGGIWLDPGEIGALQRGESAAGLRAPQPASPAPVPSSQPGISGRRPSLLRLPNMALRSASVLVGLYAILTLLLITASLFLDLPPFFALAAGVIIVTIQFIVSPFIMDLSLRWFYRMAWADRRDLPQSLWAFIEKVCADHRMKTPRVGVIDDGAPNAFTYGHTPNNARVVITRGLLNLLSEEETNAVVGHELGHAQHWDILLMTVASLVPLVLYYLYRTLMRVRLRKQAESTRLVIVVFSYLLYIVSEYIVLWFSRTREYHADRFGGQVTGDPNALARALVKIGYGLAGRSNDSQQPVQQRSGRAPTLEAIGAMGIFDAGAARALAVASLRPGSADTPDGPA